MKYGFYIDQVRSLEWGMNPSQAIAFAFCYTLPSWAEPIIVEGKVFYFASRNKVLEEAPMISPRKSADTVYRHFRALDKIGVIEYVKEGKKDLIRITKKGAKWNSENFPSYGRKKIRDIPENFPTNKITKDNTLHAREGGADPSSDWEGRVMEDRELVESRLEWESRAEERYVAAKDEVNEFLKDNPGKLKFAMKMAGVSLSDEDVMKELNLWLLHNANRPQVMLDAPNRIIFGKYSFTLWLSRKYTKDKYEGKEKVVYKSERKNGVGRYDGKV